MYDSIFRLSLRMAFLSLLLLVAAPAWAKKTGDGIVPAIETVCDGDPFSFGLCNSYCEAHDCDSDTPLGSPKSCASVLKNYMKKSNGVMPPCETSCPCAFDVESDFATLVVNGNAEFAPVPIDVEGTYQEYCGSHGPNDEDAFVAEASQSDAEVDTPQNVRLFYWVEASPATCNEVGGGLDGLLGPITPNNLHYGPWIERQISLSESEVTHCRTALQQLCP